MPQVPARFSAVVKTSERYICIGSDFSPNLNAVAGVTGVKITSHCLNASVKSRRINVRTFCART